MRFHYQRKGQGQTLILQHGFCSSAEYWSTQIDFLSPYFDVIAPTQPGFGDHSLPLDGSTSAIDRIEGYVDYLTALLAHLGVDRFHLLGHSMGGMIAQQTALTLGTRIDKLVLYGTGPNGTMPGRFEPLQTSRDRVLQHGPAATLEKTVASWFVKGHSDPEYESGLALASQAALEAIIGGYDAMAAWRCAHRLDEITMPTMVIWGEHDQAYRRDQIDLLLAGIHDCQLTVMEGCSHNVHLEQAQRFNQTVLGFLNS